MKKIINQPECFVDEVLDGIVRAYPEQLRLLEANARVILRVRRDGNKVALVTAGGSGHLPLFLGYVGQGMLDGCAVGNVFASPSAAAMADLIRACDSGRGVLCLYANYGGDKLNFALAREKVALEGIQTEEVLACDDIASAPPAAAHRRRGVAGIVYAYKVAGAAAESGWPLEAVAAVARKALDQTRTVGVAIMPCIVPDVGKPTFTIAEDEIEIGMGIHGEPGIETRKMMTADDIAALLLERIEADMPLERGNTVSVLVNGLGGTPLEEQLLIYRRLDRSLADRGISIFMPHIGEFATSMEMAGLSVTLIKLDEDLRALLRRPAATPFYTNANK